VLPGVGKSKTRFRKANIFAGQFSRPCWLLKRSQERTLTEVIADVTLATVQVAARFFSGVPHPYLLGVRCLDILFWGDAN
jgi:hypothetical protein